MSISLSYFLLAVLKECANISLDIDSDEEVIDMCKAWSDAQKDSAILATIDTWREVPISEAEIKNKIMDKYNLAEKEAAGYMLKKSA